MPHYTNVSMIQFHEDELLIDEPCKLEAGGVLPRVALRYAVYGRLNERRDNAVLICHALTGSARVAEWWGELVGAGKAFDTSRLCVIGINIIGSPYGSTSPVTLNPHTNRTYKQDFPLVTMHDIVRLQAKVIEHLGVRKLKLVAGGSIGGMQALEWAVTFPDRLETCLAIAATPLSAMGLALNHLQRQAIQTDVDFNGGDYEAQPVKGLSLARAVAMCSYKSSELFDQRFARAPNRNGEHPLSSLNARFDIAGYLDYQGEKFVTRFDANCYLTLTKAMDAFEFARDGLTRQQVLQRITAGVSLVGISSDWLFPARDVEALANCMKSHGVAARYHEIASAHGHDAFLAEPQLLVGLIKTLI